jgi:repressor LexA
VSNEPQKKSLKKSKIGVDKAKRRWYTNGVILYTYERIMVGTLTKRQHKLLGEIENGIKQDGRPPSIPELMRAMSVASPNGIAKHLNALERKGYIDRLRGARGIKINAPIAASLEDAATDRSAGIRVVPGGRPAIVSERDEPKAAYVPLVGEIAAGQPILAQEHIDEVLPVPTDMVDASTDTFLLRVRGDSMIDEGIMPGDLVMVAGRDSATDGQLVAVMVDDEATVKRFYRRGNTVVLEPANEQYQPIEIDLERQSCNIVGIVIGLMRSYRRKL